jgi:class 3 adenylate cyclase
MLRARVDRHRCIGAGNCITLAPSAFDWHEGDFAKAAVVDAASVEDEMLREAAMSCPTMAVVIEEVEELLPWQLRTAAAGRPRRVMKTFMFTDIVGSTNLAEALGDLAWDRLLRWHDDTLRQLVASGGGEIVNSTGDGFFAAFDSARSAIDSAIAIQRALIEHRETSGFALAVRIGLHTAEANRRGADYTGMGVHVAARVGALASGGEVLATAATLAEAGDPPTTGARAAEIRGVTEPIDLAAVAWS